MDHNAARAAPRLTAALAALLLAPIASCRGPEGSLAVIDPVFAYLSPDGAKSFGSAARDAVTLPENGASAALYAAVDSARPRIVFLSPLLSPEIQAILSRDESARVAYLGNASPRPDARLYAAVFSSADAATMAAPIVASESAKIGAEARTAAVFAGIPDADAVSAAFIEAFKAAGGRPEPILEVSQQGFSQAVADRLKAMDIRAAYIAAPPRDAERWASQAFDLSAFVVIEQGLPPSPTVSSADAFISWDIGASLSSLAERMEEEMPGTFPGAWKSAPTERYAGNRRSGSGR